MLGLYFHWPYCLSKCIYCDFGSLVINDKQCKDNEFQNLYLECCKKQLQYFASKIDTKQKITTIYFGGGTPSLIKEEIIEKLLTASSNLFNISKDCEITLEANPTSFEKNKFLSFKQSGINRISLGVQSMSNNNLLWLGRKHNIEQAIDTIYEIKKHFNKWSFDLIYGLPKQTLNQWIDELKQALLLEPQHLSLYTLIIDKNTPLGKMVDIGNIKPKTEDELAEFYISTNDFIKQNSQLKQYEVSNYAIENFESKHNLNYWLSYDYIGVGSGAHGRLTYKDNRRYEIQNIFNPNEWRNNILQKKQNGLSVEKQINQQEQVEEILIMGLRTKYGINFDDIKQRFNLNLLTFLNINKLYDFEKQNFLTFKNKNLILTAQGLIILDEILRNILK